jgi:hypothetical protein
LQGVSEHSSLVLWFLFPLFVGVFLFRVSFLEHSWEGGKQKGETVNNWPTGRFGLGGFLLYRKPITITYYIMPEELQKVFAGLDLRLKQTMDMFLYR